MNSDNNDGYPFQNSKKKLTMKITTMVKSRGGEELYRCEDAFKDDSKF